MPALATVADAVDRSERSFTDEQVWRLATLLDDSSKAIRNYTSQHFNRKQHIYKPRTDWKIVLPQRPDVQLISIVDPNGNPITNYQYDGVDTIVLGSNTLYRFDLEPFMASELLRIVITYVAGYGSGASSEHESIPDDIIGVCCNMALRALGTTPEDGGLTQEAITNYSYQRGQASAAGAVGMLPLEKEILNRYRRAHSWIYVGR